MNGLILQLAQGMYTNSYQRSAQKPYTNCDLTTCTIDIVYTPQLTTSTEDICELEVTGEGWSTANIQTGKPYTNWDPTHHLHYNQHRRHIYIHPVLAHTNRLTKIHTPISTCTQSLRHMYPITANLIYWAFTYIAAMHKVRHLTKEGSSWYQLVPWSCHNCQTKALHTPLTVASCPEPTSHLRPSLHIHFTQFKSCVTYIRTT